VLKNNQNLQNLSSFCICLPSDCRPDPSRQDQSHFARDHVLAPDLLARRLEVAVARRRRHPKKEREKKRRVQMHWPIIPQNQSIFSNINNGLPFVARRLEAACRLRLEVAVVRRRRLPKQEREKKKTCTNALTYNTSKPVNFLEHK